MAGPESAVVITGASRGIGRACALHLDRQGYTVFAGVRKPEDAEAVRRAGSERLIPLTIDITLTDSVAAAAEEVARALDGRGLHGLVNNAGYVVAAPLEFVPMRDLRQQFEVNVFAQMHVIQAFLPLLRLGSGRVVNMSSVAGMIALPFMGPYSASKFAFESLCDSLRLEMAPLGVGVSIVEAGITATGIWDASFEAAVSRQDELLPEARAIYAERYRAAREAMARLERGATPVHRVARAVAHALGSRRPRTRYRVGRTSTLIFLATLLPDRLRDFMVRRYLGV